MSAHVQGRGALVVNGTGLYPAVGVESGEVPAVGPAGARLLTGTVRAVGLDTALSGALESWRRPLAVHDPGKIVADLALCAALGGDHLSDLSLLRCAEEVFGPVASDPTVCRLIKTLAGDVEAVEAAVEAARGEVRRRVWSLAGGNSPTAGISAASPLVIDVDATLVEVHSAKEWAAPTFKGGFGYHPLTAWLSLSMFLCERVRSEVGVDSVGVGGGEPGGVRGRCAPVGGDLSLDESTRWPCASGRACSSPWRAPRPGGPRCCRPAGHSSLTAASSEGKWPRFLVTLRSW